MSTAETMTTEQMLQALNNNPGTPPSENIDPTDDAPFIRKYRDKK